MMSTLIVLLAAVLSADADTAVPGDEVLRGYLLAAGANHPALKARHEAWLAALERVPQVTSLDDPKFTYGNFIRSNNFTHRVAISQKFPWFGTLKGRGRVAESQAAAALSRLEIARLDIYAAVKVAYFAYEHLGRQLEITESQVELLAYMEEVVLSKYSLGLSGQDDLLRIQIEAEKVRDRRAQFLLLRPSFAAILNEALGRSTDLTIPWPGDHSLPSAPPSDSQIMRWVRERNPVLQEMDHHIESRHEQKALAKLKGYPDLTAGLDFTSLRNPRIVNGIAGDGTPSFGRISGENNLLLSLSANLPLFQKRVKAGIAEAQHLENSAMQQKVWTSLALERKAHTALFSVQDAERRYHLFKDSLLPKAQQGYESLQSAYASGSLQASFLDVLDSIQTLLNFELELLTSVRDWQQAAARLEAVVGGPWVLSKEHEAHGEIATE